MVKILTFPVRLPGWVLKGLYRLSHTQKTRGRIYPYYAFPAAIALLATFIIIRTVVGIWPSLGVQINGVHVHHFTWGILILAVTGFLALILQSGRAKYILAMSWGCGVAFIMDEFYPWLHLDDAAHLFERYDAVIYTAAVLVLAILMPAVIDGIRRPRSELKT
ncbi:MAG TPA: hypothetical protein VD862_04225 [Candidatus Paceibacterota bacterium]|nr:hypothetical protein [Candidatus Paceibacterota bacterium]